MAKLATYLVSVKDSARTWQGQARGHAQAAEFAFRALRLQFGARVCIATTAPQGRTAHFARTDKGITRTNKFC